MGDLVEPPKDEADKFYQNHRINVTDDGIATPRQPQSSPPLESAVDELLEDYDIDIHSPMKRDEYVQRVLALLKLQQEALLSKLVAELPFEFKTDGETEYFKGAKWGRNQTINTVKAVVNKLRLEL